MINEKLITWVEAGKDLSEITRLAEQEKLIEAKNLRDAIRKRIVSSGFNYDKATGKFSILAAVKPETLPAVAPLPQATSFQLTFSEVSNIFQRLEQLEKQMHGIQAGETLNYIFDENLLKQYRKENKIASMRVNIEVWETLNRLIERDITLSRLSKTDAISLIFAKTIEELKG